QLGTDGATKTKSRWPDDGQELASPIPRERNLVVPPDADDLLDEIILLEDVASEAGHDHLQVGAGVVDGKSERLENPHGIRSRRTDGNQPLDAREPEGDPGVGPRREIYVEQPARHGSTARMGYQRSALAEGFAESFDATAALEAIRRVSAKSEGPRGATNRARIPVRRLEQHRARSVGHLGLGAAHHAADREGALGITHQRHVRPKLPVLPIEGPDSLVRSRTSHHDRVLRDCVVAERVEWLPELPHDVVGDVYQVVDRSESDFAQPLREPWR